MNKYTYSVESEYLGKWYSVLKDTSLNFCRGYVMGKGDSSPPYPAFRLLRSDGKVMDITDENMEVGIGMIAGFPTAEQYESAAARAIERAQAIRASTENDERLRQKRGQS